MTLAPSPFWTPLFALDRLNSWLRLDADFPYNYLLHGYLKRTIYTVKVHAILDATRRWPVGLRRVVVEKQCRACDGSGVWVGDYWQDCSCCNGYDEFKANHGERCRKCAGKGIVFLRFIESTIGPLRWHTPANSWWSWGLDVYVPYLSHYFDESDEAFEKTDWQPNGKGRPLSYRESYRDLGIILRAWPHEFCSSVDFYHHVGLEKKFKQPDVAKAQQWIDERYAGAPGVKGCL